MNRFAIETNEMYGAVRIVTIMTRMGHRCGYVGINGDHPLFGVEYSSPIKSKSKKDIEGLPIGDRGIIPIFCASLSGDSVSPELYFDVHGSITYSGGEDYPVKTTQKTWWYGFDCAHCDDTPEKWTSDKVVAETIRLADQLIAFAAEGKA